MDNLNRSYDAIIIGAGIIGCAIALSLNRRGLSTLNVDSLAAPGLGSTSFSAGIVRPYYSTVEGTALAMEGHHHWANWTAYLGHEPADRLHYNQCGCLVLEAGRELNRTRTILKTVNVPFEDIAFDDLERRLSGADLRAFGPVRRIDEPRFGESDGFLLTGALFCPTGGYVADPQLACRQIAGEVRKRGGHFLFKESVVAIHGAGDRVEGVVTQGGAVIVAEATINAAGPSSAHVNSLAGVGRSDQISTRALRQEVALLGMPRASGQPCLPCVLTDPDCGVYMRPESTDSILVGSLEPPCDPLDFVSHDAYPETLSEQWTQQAWRAALRFPNLQIPNTARGIVALYDVSDDWIPILDRSDRDGYFMAIGTSGNQFKNAPLIGEMMAELICYVRTGGDHDSAPLTFTLPYTSRQLSLGAFSRKRSINRQSSFTVLG